ncbi:hypothetical protein PPSIR1_35067 [Plesiocystis pacifica SIR-1]|uniref:Uncharacterized protein n=1 Tax=Plesiocystis pacifica SIR-1 TaxID=391625 RepID=A6G3S1_9BACT|nr:hypothetical protein [Plesiocystis pacifica]EDM79458.1 hypothetical protein PPSIR1_35067 [Plesiocystis pacifica SIR-1]
MIDEVGTMKAVICKQARLRFVIGLGSPERHAKILIDPKSDASEPVAPR